MNIIEQERLTQLYEKLDDQTITTAELMELRQLEAQTKKAA